jgi:hypothetical protein
MSISEIYKQIGQKLSDHFENNDWKEITLKIMRVDKTVSFEGNYLDNMNSGHNLDVSLGYTESKVIHELHKITTEGGNNRWNRAVFKLLPDGKFDMEFIWDQELHDEIERLNK